MKLPDVRDQLHILATDIEAAGLAKEATKLRALAEETKRRRPFKRSAQKAKPMTAEVKAEIRETYRRHPGWSNRQIGLSCGVDGGRVSEVLAGYRK